MTSSKYIVNMRIFIQIAQISYIGHQKKKMGKLLPTFFRLTFRIQTLHMPDKTHIFLYYLKFEPLSMNILYEDSFCQVTDVCITIRKYYFPLATSKTILYQDLAKISLEDGLNVRHQWGPCTHYLNNWFHYDGKRGGKQKFLSFKMKGQRVMPALSPEDPVRVFGILQKHFQGINRRSVFNQEGQTAMDHKEAQEQQKAMKEMEEQQKSKKIQQREEFDEGSQTVEELKMKEKKENVKDETDE